MKKLIGLISLISMLGVSCSTSRYPVFKKHSNYVSYEDFSSALFESDFFQYFDFSKSLSGRAHSTYVTSESATVGDVVLYENSGTKEEKHVFKYDAKTGNSYMSVEGTSDTKGKGVEIKDQSVSSLNFARHFQRFDNEGEISVISIDKAQETYYLTEFGHTGIGCISLATKTLFEYTVTTEAYEAMDSKKKLSLSFYVDDNVFTGYLEYVRELVTNKVINGVTYIVSSDVYQESSLFQYEVSEDGKAYFRVKSATVRTVRYNDAIDGHTKNETNISVVNFYHNYEMKYEKVKVSEIDVNSYAQREKDILVEQ